MQPFVLRAGALATAELQRNGLTPDSLVAFGAPAGGPKFFIQAHLDRFLFSQWLPQRREPLPAFGSSIGAFRLLAAAHRDPTAASERLVQAYLAQQYQSKPDAREITRQVNLILGELLQASDVEYTCITLGCS